MGEGPKNIVSSEYTVSTVPKGLDGPWTRMNSMPGGCQICRSYLALLFQPLD